MTPASANVSTLIINNTSQSKEKTMKQTRCPDCAYSQQPDPGPRNGPAPCRLWKANAVGLAGVVLLAPALLLSATRTWNGADGDGNWMTSDNWDGTGAPAANDVLHFGGAVGVSNQNDFPEDTSFAGLTFLPGASAFTLSGNRVVLGGDVVNQSSAGQTISLPLRLTTADRTLNASNGPLVVASGLTYSGASTRYYIKGGPHELVFTGSTIVTNASCRFRLAEGTLRFASGSRFHLVETSSLREFFRIGTVPNTATAMVIEEGADVAIGAIYLQESAASTSTSTFDLLVDGGSLALTALDNTFGDQPGNRATLTINKGGRVSNLSPDAFVNVGTRIPMTITINDGAMHLGNLSMGRGAAATDNRQGTCDITIKKGAINLMTALYWMTSNNSGRTNTVTVGDGRLGFATLSTPLMVRGGPGTAILNFNGGILECLAASGNFLSGITKVSVLEGGAVIDTQANDVTITESFTSATQDGGITKRGSGSLTLANTGPHTFSGPVTVEAGTLALRNAAASLPAGVSLEVKPGAAFHASTPGAIDARTVTAVSSLTLGGASAEPAGLALWADENDADTFSVASSVTLGNVALSFYQNGTLDPVTYPGTYTLMTYAGADPSLAEIEVVNPSDICTYGITLDIVSTPKRVLLTVALKPDVSSGIWSYDGDGDWLTGTNWEGGEAPTDIPHPVNFANVLTQPATVTVNTSPTVGGLTFAADHSYTVLAETGAETITLSGASPAITVLRGSHTVATALALDGDVSFIPNDNTFTLAAPVSGGAGAALTLATPGTLHLAGATIGTALHLASSTLISGSGVLNGPVTGTSALHKGPGAGILELAHPANTYSGGTRVSGGTLALRGGGVPGTGTVTLEGDGVLATAGTGSVGFGNPVIIATSDKAVVTNDAPLTTTGTFTMPAARVLRKQGTNTWNFAGTFDVGGSSNYRLRLDDGTLRFAPGSFFRMTGAELLGDADTALARQQILTGESSNRNTAIIIEENATVTVGSLFAQINNSLADNSFALTINNGEFILAGMLCLGDGVGSAISVAINGGEMRQTNTTAWADIGTRSKVNWTVNGGTVSLGRAAFGRQNAPGSGRNRGGTTLTVNGGTFEARDFFSWKSTDDTATTNTVTVNPGGTFSVPATQRYHAGGRVILNLNGGTLGLRGQPSANTSLHGSLFDVLYGVNELNVLSGGAVFETIPATNAMVITQTLTPAGGADGGITKLGGGALTLVADVALTGAVTVAEGTLGAAFTSTPDLAVNADATLHLTRAATFASVSGSGTATNATLTLTGTLSPGDAEGETGTFHAEHLAFADGAGIRLDWTGIANDRFAVSGNLTGASGGFIDFGRELGDTVPVPFTAVIGTYGGSVNGQFRGWKVRNAGYPPARALTANIAAENGVVTLNVRDTGLVLTIR